MYKDIDDIIDDFISILNIYNVMINFISYNAGLTSIYMKENSSYVRNKPFRHLLIKVVYEILLKENILLKSSKVNFLFSSIFICFFDD